MDRVKADYGSKRLRRENWAWRNREEAAPNTVCIMAQRKQAINHYLRISKAQSLSRLDTNGVAMPQSHSGKSKDTEPSPQYKLNQGDD